ncbi:DNA-3-methyladenine glycosylase family protein [Cryptosporangium phraense]|uniref:DNA-3-methyladenine glycosylase II n=1 Tax=Cryptosporangium phraense TaxID=2593070 RepID=A0A545AV96_9ACTN|nr:DNA-3-methyladenine glycosylase [Cryptosporangium phraense]TQS45257.1 DNA-3-methyladenine glycosylase 2 family protein [Cryptosporangium phraense]
MTPTADAFLSSADPILKDLITRFGPLPDRVTGLGDDPFDMLVLTISSQQLSTRSARAIYERIRARYGGRAPTPDEIWADDPELLRTSTGLSHAKVRALRSLSEHLLTGLLDFDRLRALDDDAMRALVCVTGIGEWTASIFLMFALGRPDVLVRGDLAIRQAIRRAYGLESLPSLAAVTALGEAWRPYRSRACLYLWRSVEISPVG